MTLGKICVSLKNCLFRSFAHFLKKILFIFRETKGGMKRGREGEKHQCVVASHVPPTGGLACNPGMCPDWESNWRPFGLQASIQSTEPHQSEIIFSFSFLSMVSFSSLDILKIDGLKSLCSKFLRDSIYQLFLFSVYGTYFPVFMHIC